ncbi:flagellar hook-associated protein FlgK [Chitinibacteraceae bacterium HSL-7]
MASSVFSIGLSGLNAANLGLVTTGHNISNVNTDGYSRQYIKQSAIYPQLTGSGFVGLGVRVDTIQRSYDQFLTRSLQGAQSQASYLETYLSHLKELDNIVADPNAGVSPALQDFFAAVQNVSTNPASTPARTALIAAGQTLVNRFQSFEDRLADSYNSLNGELRDTTKQINAIGSQIAQLNAQISLTAGVGQPPNDLLDQRDQLIRELNTYVKGTVVEQSDGSYNIFIGNGQNLVLGANSYEMAAEPSPSDPTKLAIVLKSNGNNIYLPENQLVGGKLEGLLKYRTGSLDLARNSLAQVAMGMAQTFNMQHSAGLDLQGFVGRDFFSFPSASQFETTLSGARIQVGIPSGSNASPSDYSLVFDGTDYTLTRLSDNQSTTITAAQMGAGYSALGVDLQLLGGAPAAAGTASFSTPPAIGRISPNTLNTGNATVDGWISNVGQLTTSDYELGYDGTNYVLTRLSDRQQTVFTPAQIAAGPITQDGLSLRITAGTMNTGDRFTIKPYEGFVRSMGVSITDPRDIAAAAPVSASVPTSNTGTLSITQPMVDAPGTGTTSAAINPALRNPVTINFTSPTSFTYTDTVTGVTSAAQTYTPGMTLAVNGWSMKLDGKPLTGDVINVTQTVAGNADNRNALALGNLQTSRLMNNGSSTYQEAYGQMVSEIGIQTSEATVRNSAQQVVLQEAQKSRDTVAGVNLDEEAANLLRYQQAYMAASKVIQIAKEAFDEIKNIL